MDLRSYGRLLRRRWITLTALTVLGALLGAVVAMSQSRAYEAKTGFFVSTANSGSDLTQEYQGTLLAQQTASSYASLMTNDHVLAALIRRLDLPYSSVTLKREVKAINPAGTALVAVTVRDESAARALAIANAYSGVFSEFVAGFGAPGLGQSSASGLRVSATGPALLQTVPPPRALDVLLGLGAGLVVGVAGAVMREITDTRVRDREDVARFSGAPALGILSEDADPKAYRRLGVDLQLVDATPGPLAVVVTAAADEKDAARVATDLALTLARGDERVILVEADGGSTVAGGLPGVTAGPGLREVLAGWTTLDRALQRWRNGLPLSVLTRGEAKPVGRNALRDDGLGALRDELTARADVVIFAAPPVLLNSGTVILSQTVGHALVVARAGQTRGHELAESVDCLRAAKVTVSGVVLYREAGGPQRNHRLRPTAPQAGADQDRSEQPARAEAVQRSDHAGRPAV